jgi:F-type H+-transporting ATPase subunit gamma
MASLKEIGRRLASVKNTKKITYAMKLVSAAKLRKAQEAVQRSRAYSGALQELLSSLGSEIDLSEIAHPLLAKRDKPQKIGVLVIGGSRGLCGGYNSNINRKIDAFYNERKNSSQTIHATLLSKKAAEYYRRTSRPIEVAYENLPEDATRWEIEEICKTLEEKFISGKLDEVYMIYTKFKSAMSMTVMTEKILPIEPANLQAVAVVKTTAKSSGLVLFEPSAREVFAALIPRIMRSRVRQASLDAKASEYGSRMTAMESATKNAGDLIKKLQLSYNKIRQGKITSELLDILGGSEATQ